MPSEEEKLTFSARVEQTAIDLVLSHWEALLHICETNQYEVEIASTLLTQSLIDEITEDAHILKLLKHKANTIPGL